MTGHLLTVGDEILLGQIVNTNAAWLGRAARRGRRGPPRAARPSATRSGAIAGAIERATDDGAALVVVTGGLGPTHDDVTRAAVAQAFGRPLEFRADVVRADRGALRARGRDDATRRARHGRGAGGLRGARQPEGSAPGLWGEREVDGRRQLVVVLPGVPHEMRAIMEASVLPRLVERQDGVVLSRTLLTAGRGESDIAAMIAEQADALPDGLHARLPARPRRGPPPRHGARARPRGRPGATSTRRPRRSAPRSGELGLRRGDDVARGRRATTCSASAASRLAVAESCTGGAISARADVGVRRERRVLRGRRGLQQRGQGATSSTCPSRPSRRRGP